VRHLVPQYKHVIIEFDKDCTYSRGEACAWLDDAIKNIVEELSIYARINSWFGSSTVIAVYIKLFPRDYHCQSSVAIDARDKRDIPYIASQLVSSAVLLTRRLKRKCHARKILNTVADFVENVVDCMDLAGCKKYLRKWIAEKRKKFEDLWINKRSRTAMS